MLKIKGGQGHRASDVAFAAIAIGSLFGVVLIVLAFGALLDWWNR